MLGAYVRYVRTVPYGTVRTELFRTYSPVRTGLYVTYVRYEQHGIGHLRWPIRAVRNAGTQRTVRCVRHSAYGAVPYEQHRTIELYVRDWPTTLAKHVRTFQSYDPVRTEQLVRTAPYVQDRTNELYVLGWPNKFGHSCTYSSFVRGCTYGPVRTHRYVRTARTQRSVRSDRT